MANGIECKQVVGGSRCGMPAAFRYTWPGRDESHICVLCAIGLCRVASTMGLHVQLIRLLAEDHVRVAERP